MIEIKAYTLIQCNTLDVQIDVVQMSVGSCTPSRRSPGKSTEARGLRSRSVGFVSVLASFNWKIVDYQEGEASWASSLAALTSPLLPRRSSPPHHPWEPSHLPWPKYEGVALVEPRCRKSSVVEWRLWRVAWLRYDLWHLGCSLQCLEHDNIKHRVAGWHG